MNFLLLPSPESRRRVCDFLLTLPTEKRWNVVVEEVKAKRTLSANAYYFGYVVTPLARHCGYTPDEMHDEILGSYFGWEKKSFMGHEREVPRRRSTTNEMGQKDELTPEDFKNLTVHAERIAAELGVPLTNDSMQEAG